MMVTSNTCAPHSLSHVYVVIYRIKLCMYNDLLCTPTSTTHTKYARTQTCVTATVPLYSHYGMYYLPYTTVPRRHLDLILHHYSLGSDYSYTVFLLTRHQEHAYFTPKLVQS